MLPADGGVVSAVLKDDGVFVFTVPNITSLKNKIRVMLGMMPQYACSYSSLKHGHMRDYNLGEVRLLAGRHDFRITKIAADKVMINRLKLNFIARLVPSLGDILIIRAEK